MTGTDTVLVTAGSEGIAPGSLTVTLTGLNAPTTPNASEDVVELISDISSQSASGTIESSFSTDTATCTISAIGSTGTVTINEAHAYPNSAGSLADFYIDFTVNKEMPYGSLVEIKLTSAIGTLFTGSSAS